MADSIFPLEEAGDFFNPRFVSVKFDMERGEGIAIREKYGVRAFPTFLLLAPGGEEQYRVVGAGTTREFIARVKRGLKPGNTFPALEKEHASGKMTRERKLARVLALQEAYSPLAADAARELLAELDTREKLSATYWPLVNDRANPPTLATLALVADNLALARANIGKGEVALFLEGGYNALLDTYITGGVASDEGRAIVATLRDHRERGCLPPDDQLDLKMEIAAALSDGDPARVVTLVRDGVSRLALPNIFKYMLAFNNLDKTDKALMALVVQAGEAIIASNGQEAVKQAVETFLAPFRKAAATGTYWESLTLEEALEAAGKSGKHVFVDCYTTWCGPCKYMTATVFPRADVGDFFNRHFINVKFDMEAGDGPAIARRYNVRAYPTFMILRPDGTVQHKIVGSSDDIVQEARAGLDDKTATGTLDRQFDAGNRDKEFLTTYLRSLVNLYETERGALVVDTLNAILTDDEKTSERYWFIYEDDTFTPEESGNFKYLLARRKAFIASVGKEAVDRKIFNLYMLKLYPVLIGQESRSPGDLARLKKEVSRHHLTGQKELLACIEIVKGHVAKDPDKLLKTCKKEFRHLTEDRVDIAIFTLRYLKENTTGHLRELKTLAATIEKKLTIEMYKEYIHNLLDDQPQLPPETAEEEA
jgi:thiol-disulfide isomerase/thioredoxin